MAKAILKLLQSLMLVALVICSPLVAAAANTTTTTWLCDGDALTVTTTAGAVDITGLPDTVPNIEAGTAPGDGVLISWRGLQLQLPRTNNAGAPSYTDGRWWWRAADPAHPEWKQRRGGIISYDCSATTPSS